MAPTTINILLSSFPGLGLPSTLCTPVPFSSSISSFTSSLANHLPNGVLDRLTLTTTFGKRLDPTSPARISSLLTGPLPRHADFLSLRLSAPLLGGKGGFGSQLRAAGGRMSSRKKRQQGDPNASSRNLDGRRLRTVTEAKALAEYLAVKPEMDKKEKEERRKRWEQVVEAAERREAEIKSGNGKARIDGKWLEEKEEAESKTREAIALAMREGLLRDDTRKLLDDSSGSTDESDTEAKLEHSDSGMSSKATTPPSGEEGPNVAVRRVFGWDEEDDDNMSDSEEDKDESKANETETA